MSPEQRKTRVFFDKLTRNEIYTTGCWVLVGVSTSILGLLFFLPVQEILVDIKESVPLLLLMVMCGPTAAYFRIMPYQAYGNQPNHKMMSELIKYHPVNRVEKKKMEVFYSVRYMAKVAGVCMFMQLIVSLFVYGKISWVNIVYAIVVFFCLLIVPNA